MGSAIGHVLPPAVGVALSPVPIIAVLVIGAKLVGEAIGGFAS